MMNDANLRKRNIISFSVFLGTAVVLLSLWAKLSKMPEDESIPPAFRQALEMNGRLWHSLFSPQRLAPERAPVAAGKPARLNGDLGLLSRIDMSQWRLDVDPNSQDPKSLHLQLKMEDIRALPQVQTTFEFKCIEGWSQVISYTGVRFSDFLKAYKLGSHSKDAWRDGKLPANRFLYVGLETPDGEYYVSLDMESMLHPQTLLVYEMNGAPLTIEHGAPLRLIVPVKYGIKSLKRIGRIYFSDKRPPDYWAERGYDWFSGL